MNVFFYSNKDNLCRELLTLMNNYKLLPYFKLICVDGQLDKMPEKLNTVPTIIATNMKNPLEGDKAVEWIKSTIFLRQKRMNMHINNNTETGPKGHSDEEMQGFSDNFAYKDIDFSQPKSFVGAKDDSSMILTVPNMKKINESEQKILLNQELRKRKQQNDNFKKDAKERQLQSVINVERNKIMEDINTHQIQQMEQAQKIQQFQQMQKMKQMQQMHQMRHIQQMQNQNQNGRN